MTNTNDQPAFIYCRVSSTKQVREGHGLESQEQRCRDYARYRGHKVIEVFRDEGVSGGLIDRPAMKDMLKRVANFSRKTQPVIIVDDISRLEHSWIERNQLYDSLP